jgi:uncharacterized protein (DUF1697 family)
VKRRQTAKRQRYVAFLRAINVGGHTVKMDRLRSLFESLGFTDVSTFIASGNVIFEAPEADARAREQRIERHLHKSLGFEVGTFIRSMEELAAVAAYVPFPKEPVGPASRLWIGFLPAPLSDEARRALMSLQTEVDVFDAHGREWYWLRRGKLMESLITGPQLGKVLQMSTTTRNQNTVQRLVAKYGGEASS